jgi:hypothetical protein
MLDSVVKAADAEHLRKHRGKHSVLRAEVCEYILPPLDQFRRPWLLTREERLRPDETISEIPGAIIRPVRQRQIYRLFHRTAQ